jgi:hypothetical protein
MGAQASAFFTPDQLKERLRDHIETRQRRHLRRNIDASASKRARKLLRGDEARRLYDEAALLAKYAGPELVARDSVAIFLDWDDTLFPSTWIQMQQRSRGLNLIQHDPAMKALCSAIVSFLSSVARLGHLFIVTASAPGFITKCCRVCFPELLTVLDDLNVTVIYARPTTQDQAENETVEQWKEAVYRVVLEGRSLRPLVPELARFDGAPQWSLLLSYGDEWSDHASLRSAMAAVSPGSVHRAAACSGTRPALTWTFHSIWTIRKFELSPSS